jgi:DNA repair protein RadD
MIFLERWYQNDAVSETFEAIKDDKEVHPVIVAPTGSGKTVILCKLIDKILSLNPVSNVLVLAADKRILGQNKIALENYFEGIEIGLCSSGLKAYFVKKITVAGIQSVYRKSKDFLRFDHIIIDECFPAEVEILTDDGFIRFDNLKSEKVAQYENGKIEFVSTLRKIKKKYKGKMVKLKNDTFIDISMTVNHDLVIEKNGVDFKAKAGKESFNYNKSMYCAGEGAGNNNLKLTPIEKLKIAFQADGSIHTNLKSGGQTLSFSFSKARKIKEFVSLMEEGGFNYKLNDIRKSKNKNVKDSSRFMVYDLKGFHKNILDEFEINISGDRAREIIDYCMIWDGHIRSDKGLYFSSINESAVDFYQTVCALSGYRSVKSIQFDGRSLMYNDIHRLHILKTDKINTQRIKKEFFDYDDYVYCVSVPTGKIVVRSNGRILVAGNCHLINTKETGMYRSFLNKLTANYIGLTATHFRTNHGYIHEGKDALFNKISYDMSSPEIYNRIVDEGYLSQLLSYPTDQKLSGDGCRVVAGDWNEKDLSEKNDRIEITNNAILEVLKYGKNYHHWLFAAIDIQHCENIVACLNHHNIKAVAIHSRAKDVDQKIEDFKNGKYKAAVQVNMLITGFDFPGIDLIADMRPTKSPIIHVQFKGRGGRVVYADGYDLETVRGRLDAIENGTKQHCLVLDFSGNIARLGPINHVKIKTKGEGKGNGDAITKNCPDCNFINWGGAKFCENCDHEFVFKEKLVISASTSEIVVKKKQFSIPDKVKGWFPVDQVRYKVKTSFNTGLPYIEVKYRCGFSVVYENVFIEESGYPKHKAKHWIDVRWNEKNGSQPNNVLEFKENYELIESPTEIKVSSVMKKREIIDYKF